MIKFFLQWLHRYYITCIKSVPIAMLYHVWLIITSVYVKLGLMTPLQYVRSLSGLIECILNIALPYHMHRQKQTFLFTVNVCVVCVVIVVVCVFVVWYMYGVCVQTYVSMYVKYHDIA